LLLALAGIAWLLGGGTAAQFPQVRADGRPLEPWIFGWRASAGYEGEYGGLLLHMGLRAAVATQDSVWIEVMLTHRFDHPIGFHIEPDAAPLLVLTAKGKKPQVRPLTSQPALQRLRYDTRSQDGRLYEFRADLRGYFGKLEAGTYDIEVVFPAKGYRIEGRPGFQRVDAKVKATFLVSAGDLGAASRAILPEHRMIVRNPPAADGPPTGTLTNGFKKPILVRVPPSPDGSAQKAPLRLNMVWQRWDPLHDWRFPVNELPEDRTHWPVYRLAPGQSVSVVLPEWELEGDGIYRFGVAVYDAEKEGTPFLTRVGTDAFVINRVTSPPAEQSPK